MVGSGGSGDEEWRKGGGRQFESRRNVKLMSLGQCIILWSENWPPPCQRSSLDFIYPLYLSLGQVKRLMLGADSCFFVFSPSVF